MPYIYRRASGTFYARLRVPDNLRAVLGSSDLRKSLRTTDYHAATKLALQTAAAWKQEFQRIEAMLDANKLAAGSPILLTSGLIRLDHAAEAAGLKVETYASGQVTLPPSGRACSR
ncbi:DUF6538 domain-containing protein [Xenophilus azovorans]|uniref:DUF6538 domain-containing protein n=1 Tax=Xenophilus azovorans TaxID=151755 RepID=UPI0012ED85EF|nr:DUF6538 domain-containing protein [Xenophilus azovorans]